MRTIGIHLESNCVRYHCASVAQTVISSVFRQKFVNGTDARMGVKGFFCR